MLSYSQLARAVIPQDAITRQWRTQNQNLMNPQAWQKYVESRQDVFSNEAASLKGSVLVLKEDITIDAEKYVFGTAYRQVRLNTTLERAKNILLRPDLFRETFGLDEEAHAPVDPKQLPTDFTARIKKHIPIVPDQIYQLHYKIKEIDDFLFQTVEQLRDENDFALRETLVVLQKSGDTVIFREIARVMPLSWAMRALGAQLRQITKSELTKMNSIFKCMAESKEPISDKLALSCSH